MTTRTALGIEQSRRCRRLESKADFLCFREAGCDLVQGDFVARPTTDMTELAQASPATPLASH